MHRVSLLYLFLFFPASRNRSSSAGKRVRATTAVSQYSKAPELKVIDVTGCPIVVSAVLVYRIVDAKKALLYIENVHKYVTSQASAALKEQWRALGPTGLGGSASAPARLARRAAGDRAAAGNLRPRPRPAGQGRSPWGLR